jgi:predicted nuclease of predicted toxin-antitoxin system
MQGLLLITLRSGPPMLEPLKLYLDQMLRLDVARALRDEGYDVMRASEVGQARADDYDILQKAIAEDRILITLDEHFGDWVVLPLCKHHGVIRVKANPTTAKNITEILIPFLSNYSSDKFKNHLVILSQKRAKWIHTV